jgi:hypothetical protein
MRVVLQEDKTKLAFTEIVSSKLLQTLSLRCRIQMLISRHALFISACTVTGKQ